MRNIQLFSTDTDDGVVSVVAKTGSNEHRLIKQIRVGNAPRGGVKFTKSGRGFVCNTSQNTLSEIDAVSLVEVRRIEVGHGPRGLGIVPNEKYMLVSNSGSDTVSVVDLGLNVELRQVAVGRDPRHMGISADGLWAYVCVWGDGYISKLDLASLATGDAAGVAEVARIEIDQAAHPYSLNITPDGSRVFVANTQATYVTVVDVATNEVHNVDLGAIGGRAITFSADGKFALVTVETQSRVYVIDVETLEVKRHLPVGAGPRGLTLDKEDNTLYVTNFKRTTDVVMEGGPDFGANALTKVDLSSAPLDRQEGSFSYEEVVVGFGPCSVVMFDLDTIPEDERAKRLDYTQV
ncbi:hypothetical protein ATKI12_8854 [Kitasatospora sp. Ki12]